ncbi:alkaline phosphatase D family protein [Novosphingopyxis sp. YJ-S2-01]|uniref:alkaline phosphatase D family protein n=1 Tax=Novosphingopyxis sp. YJ-S2-01 TaxID=2794021 RepID=UPI0018DE7CCA|nr:alkaline phosphatase D family protein [Novosphingopyxis sp. YJ-S2-01]MBH9537341.1 alkaline phosphatase D family protein [Novosphingopyxis sp. YJ-S2-01]
MTLQIDRRLLLQAGTFGIGALTIPGAAFAFQSATGFSHGVASGEPGQDSVLLWTRYVGSGDTRLTVEVTDPATGKVVGGGSTTASPTRDYCAKLVVDGLQPGRWYYYRFVAPDGSASPQGRTRTLPDGETDKWRMGVFSCSNMPFGYFNAYAAAAARDDLDIIMHLGDYFYEYGPGTYPDVALPGRAVQPDHEILTLTDYRLRYQSYRADPDLQRVHQLWPMLAQWDDHEIANDAWEHGAQNHQPNEGDYEMRKRIARRTYREWMPVHDLPDTEDQWKSYRVGDLATILLTESRLHARAKQFDLSEVLQGKGNIEAALVEFREQTYRDPAHTMLGLDQEGWFADQLKRSVGAGEKWQVWAQQTVMGTLLMPQQTLEWIPESAPDYVKQRSAVGALASKAGLPFNFDSWDGYPAARSRAFKAAQDADADLVVLSGDSHNGWAFDLTEDGRPVGVEFAGHSVTSPGMESYFSTVPAATLEAAIRETNPMLKWANFGKRGYMTVELTPTAASCDWNFVSDIAQRSSTITGSQNLTARRGERVLTQA